MRVSSAISIELHITRVKENPWYYFFIHARIFENNAIKNALAKDIPGYLEKAEYLGWRPIAEGKHSESAYFAYFSRDFLLRSLVSR